ncbi:MAG: VOC family protein [Sphaerochaetaceae bacterium]|jgi:catechol 2,3-dioxygenase-like lactoylglutathione lyase family enzyme
MEYTSIRLLVEKFDECFVFYHKTLGLTPLFGKCGEVYALFDIGNNVGLELFNTDLMASEVNTADLAIPNNNRDKSLWGFKDDNLDETYLRLKAKGVTFLNAPHDIASWGMRVVHFRDPEGNLIEINKNLA